ncbi:MAG: hypothetical protein Q8O01_03095 [Candidatus Omnitrophota bacterium]|nr:hypothetical protein [Candidatus Omnitrophota bacterium]
MRKRMLMVLVTALLITIPVFGATLPDENAAKDLGDKIMAKVSSGDIENAFNLMKPYAPVSATEIDSAAVQTKAALEQYGKRYGEPIGFELIDSKKLGDSLLRIRYVAKMKNNALPWVFIFYKGANGWTLNDFKWKDTVLDLFIDN